MKNWIGLFSGTLVCLSALAQTNPVLNVTTYKLNNGFTVFLNEDPTASKVFGAVMVNAGAKQESPDATGMAHYLEHLLFKGTNRMGSTDFAQEKPLQDSIVWLYDELAKTAVPEEKVKIQQHINALSIKASAYGLPNEFDKLLRSIGGTGINAFTNYDMTFYHNSFPAHEINKWLDLYASRFQNPVFRSFQSELEVVYEEKNRSMDNFTWRVFEKFQSMLFPNLPYGQWPVLGTVEHLKNPQLSKMYAFYNKHYVADNMALILSGNFDAKTVGPLIQEKFGVLKPGPYTPIQLPALQPIQGVKTEYVKYTPVKAGLIGFQTVPQNHPDRTALDVCEYLLFNQSETGYLNRLQSNNEIMYCGAFPIVYNNAGGAFLFYVPKILSQSLDKAEAKVMAGFTYMKDGKFSETELNSAKNSLIKEFKQELEHVEDRGVMIGQAFNNGQPWEEHLKYPEKVQAITRDEIMRVAKKYYGDNYVRLISGTGFPKNSKLEKPPYKAVVTEQKGQSEYATQFGALPTLPFAPKFIDYTKDVAQISVGTGHNVYAVPNPVNDLFYLELRFKTGKLHNPVLETAVDFVNFCGAGSYSLQQLKEAFSAIGCQYSLACDDNFVTLHLEGKETSLQPCLDLARQVLTQPKSSDKSKALLLNELKTERKFEKRAPDFMGQALLSYALYGKDSPQLKRKSIKEIAAFSEQELVDAYLDITTHVATDVLFVGNTPADDLTALLKEKLPLSASPRETYIFHEGNAPTQNSIYFVNDPKAVQSQVYFYVPGELFEANSYADVMAFNEYFAGGFSGLVLQEIREYRSLAYSTGGRYALSPVPGKKSKLITFIGCQADKTTEAIQVMTSLLKNMPLKEERMADLQQALKTKAGTSYPAFSDLAQTLIDARRRGYTDDPNREAYRSFDNFSSARIKNFYEKNIHNKPYVITIYGDKSRIALDKLKELGEVKEISAKEIVTF